MADGRTPAGRFGAALMLVEGRLEDHLDDDWSRRAGPLDWTCWQTVDHLVDCLFSYALQISSGSSGSFLPLHELHALPEASNRDLFAALHGVGRLLGAAMDLAPAGPCASDGIVELDAEGWAQRGAYELMVHADDILAGFGEALDPPEELAGWLWGAEGLWMVDRDRGAEAPSAWAAVLLGSGRSAR